jgi:DNA-binding MarR family transcriptional regulator
MRQHDHAQAWMEKGLTAPEIVIMTALWRDQEVEFDEKPVASLREAGYLKKPDPPQLTNKGRKLRQAIEDDTNARSQKAFDILDAATADRFLDALRALPA